MDRDNRKNGFAAALDDMAAALSVAPVFLTHGFRDWAAKTVKNHREALVTWGVLLLVAALIFGYTLLMYGFTVPLSGDGYLQEQNFPFLFYDYWHKFFATGKFPLWDTASALGSNNIGGNSFYSLLSPFYMLMLPFPRAWIPVELGFKYVLQTALAGFLFYEYLREFSLAPSIRRVGGVAYAFCGWIMYFLWFEHFLDSFALFPLLLWGVERVLRHKDPRLLLVALFIQGLTNYFFLVPFTIGAFFYAMWRFLVLWKTYANSGERLAVLGIGFVAFAFGLLSSCFVLLPGIANAQNMPRLESTDSYLDSLKAAWSAGDRKALLQLLFLFDTNSFKSIYFLDGFFFMTNHSYSSNLVGPNWYDNASGSSFVFTPIMLVCFAGVLDGTRLHKPSHLLGFAAVGLLIGVPFFYYLFSGFTIAYARFLLVPSAWIIAYACITMSRIRTMPKGFMDASFVFVLVVQLIAGVYSLYLIQQNPTVFAAVYGWEWRFLAIPLELAYTIVCYGLLRHAMPGRGFTRYALALVAFEAVVMGNITIQMHGMGDIRNLEVPGQGLNILERETKIVSALDDYDNGIYRIQNASADRDNPNIQMRVGHNGLSAFNSVYAYNAQDFLDWSRIPYTYHNWSMGAHQRRINMEAFLGVKYYLVPRYDKNVPFDFANVLYLDPAAEPTAERAEALANLQDVLAQNLAGDDTWQVSRDLYVNQDYVDFAFPFDTVIDSRALSSGNYEDFNEYAYLRYGIVDTDDFAAVKAALGGTGLTAYDALGSVTSAFTVRPAVQNDLVPDGTTFAGTLSVPSQYRVYDVSFTRTDMGSGGFELVDARHGLTVTVDGLGDGRFTGLNSTAASLPATVTLDDQGGYSIAINGLAPIESYNSTAATKVTVYSASWEDGVYQTGGASLGHEIYPADTEIDYDNPGSNSLRGLLWYTKFVIEPRNGVPFAANATPDNPYYISVRTSDNFDWRFVYEEEDPDTGTTVEKELSLDGLQSYSDYQTAHGFYVTQPITKIVGILHATKAANQTINRPAVFVQSQGDYRLAVDRLNSEPIAISERTTDLVRFQTDYAAPKYVVLNQPREDGWTLARKNGAGLEEVTTYKSQGGFVGFVAPAGNVEYVLFYTTPELKQGILAGTAGLLGSALTIAVYLVATEKKRLLARAGLRLSTDLSADTDRELR